MADKETENAVHQAARAQGIEVLEMGLALAKEGFEYRQGESTTIAGERLLLRALEKLQS